MTVTMKTFGRDLPPPGSRGTDLICIGRGIADLYADQLGGRLEDAVSFSAYVGGSALNICVGVARLGLNAAMVLRLGDDHMGRLVRETMERNGVATKGVIVDPVAPTPLCILGVRDRETFPRDLFTNGGAYLNLTAEDLDPEMFRDARAVLINGSFFASDSLRGTCRRALQLAREAGCATVLDVDYRPALWGLVGHGSGEAAFVESSVVTESFAEFLPQFDLIVGTEEEIAIAGGSTDSLEAVRRIRAVSDATVVLKRGPAGCVAFDGPVPDCVDAGVVVAGFQIEVMNTAGAGDSFMAGFASGWLTGQSLEESCRIANACGAINVARHGCSDSAPSREEIDVFIAEGITQPEKSTRMRQLHAQLGRQVKVVPNKIGHLSATAFIESVSAAKKAVAEGRLNGLLFPATDSFAELAELTGRSIWIARKLTVDSSLRGGIQAMSTLRRWPREHILWAAAATTAEVEMLAALAEAATETRHEILADISDASDPRAVAQVILEADLCPEWWMVNAADPALVHLIKGQTIAPRGILQRSDVGPV